MRLESIFNNLASIDVTRTEYVDFKSAILNIDWRQSDAVRASNVKLAYAPGIVFSNIPFVNQHQGHINIWGSANTRLSIKNKDFEKVWATSIPMFSYIEELVPNHRVVKAEILATPPEVLTLQQKIDRVHIDPRKMHSLSRRCQIAFLSNPGCYLFVEGNKQHIDEGMIYEFDNLRCHWGVNYGNTLKLCLVVDIIDLDIWNNLNQYDKDTFFDVRTTQAETDYLNNYKHMLSLAPAYGIEPQSPAS